MVYVFIIFLIVQQIFILKEDLYIRRKKEAVTSAA